MEDFVKQNKPLVLSTLFLFLAVNLFLHVVFGGFQRLSFRNAEVIGREASIRNAELRTAVKTLVVRNRPSGGTLSTTPAFLAKINALAHRDGIHILQIAADQQNNASFQIQTRADFRAFLRFMAAVEGLDVEIVKLAIAPADPSGNATDRQIELAISPRDSGAVSNPDRVSDIRDQAETLSAAAFNPGGLKSGGQAARTGPRVTGITEIDGAFIATIDDIDYALGDEIDGWVISDIARGRVVLSDPKRKERRQRVLTLR